jgi:hypothetical protein
MTVDEAYMLTLSRLSSLKVLNYSTITPQDRRNGELYYLSLIGKELSASSHSEEQRILESHPRYNELCEVYGPPVVKRATDSSVNPRSLAARLITFKFYLPTHSSPSEHDTTVGYSQSQTSHKHTEQRRDIPRTFDIYRIKAIVARLFSIPPLRFRLIWETEEWDPIAETKADHDEWTSSEEDQGEEDPLRDSVVKQDTNQKFVRREEELVDSTREVGFWLSDHIREARVRVELL